MSAVWVSKSIIKVSLLNLCIFFFSKTKQIILLGQRNLQSNAFCWAFVRVWTQIRELFLTTRGFSSQKLHRHLSQSMLSLLDRSKRVYFKGFNKGINTYYFCRCYLRTAGGKHFNRNSASFPRSPPDPELLVFKQSVASGLQEACRGEGWAGEAMLSLLALVLIPGELFFGLVSHFSFWSYCWRLRPLFLESLISSLRGDTHCDCASSQTCPRGENTKTRRITCAFCVCFSLWFLKEALSLQP